MGGFVVAFGSPDRSAVETMFKTIKHRGPHADGTIEHNQVIMAQNYLRADGAVSQNGQKYPLSDNNGGALRICYDGQMGNGRELARSSGTEGGPFAEERLLLDLYKKQGSTMPRSLDDAIFSFVISDGKEFLASRDLLGIKTLFYAEKNGTIYFASELKSILQISEEVYEFPAGHTMDSSGKLTPFAELPTNPPKDMHTDVEKMMGDIRDIISRSFHNRIDFDLPTGSLLSGGIDSSVIAFLASTAYKERFGKDARLKTFALGVGESNDILNARIVAKHLDTDHHEVIIGLDQILEVLPDVIYYLESFDPSLVRSSVSNYLISRYAKEQGIEVLLSGEGGDEIFCGYSFLKQLPMEEIFRNQMNCLGYLHNNASLRLDRMNMCNSMRVVAPLISGELLDYALSIPPEHKVKPEKDKKVEKWIFRKAFEKDLPESVVWRLKQEFSQGSGSADVLPAYFENVISNEEFDAEREKYPVIRSKEELFYFRIFKKHFNDSAAAETVGQWVSL